MDEIAADYAGELFEGGRVLDEFIQKHREDRTLLEKIREVFRTLIAKLTGEEKRRAQTAEGKLTAVLEAAARQVNGGSQNAVQTDGGERFSIKYDQHNTPYVDVDTDILKGVPQSQWVKTVKDNLRRKFPSGVYLGQIGRAHV